MAITTRTARGTFARRLVKGTRVFSGKVQLFGAARTSALRRLRRVKAETRTEERAKGRRKAKVARGAKKASRTGPRPTKTARGPQPPSETERPNPAVAREVPRGFGRFVENLDNLGNRERGKVFAQVAVFYSLEVSPPRRGERRVTRTIDGERKTGVVRAITLDLGNLTGTQARNITSAELIALFNATETGQAERIISINVLKPTVERRAIAKRRLGPVKGRTKRRRKSK